MEETIRGTPLVNVYVVIGAVVVCDAFISKLRIGMKTYQDKVLR